MNKPLYVYNIFPRVYRDTKKWYSCEKRAKEMGFNAIYLNAFFKPGKSNSIYSIVDYYKYDELSFQKDCNPEAEIIKFINYCHKDGMLVLVDLVINHMAPESPFVKTKKEWFSFDSKGKPQADGTPSNNGFEMWKDTAKLKYYVDDRNGLKKYMFDLCKHFLSLGFDGFRCDAANHVATHAWSYLIKEVRKVKSDAIFVGEAFVCPVQEIIELGKAGFDYVFNSSKWWNYDGDWLIEQHNTTLKYVDSISFPDNHDTERLMETVNGDISLFKQRIYFTGLFSKGFCVTDGIEYGLKKKLDVFKTSHLNKEHKRYNFKQTISDMLKLKNKYKALHNESYVEKLHNDNNYLCLKFSYEEQEILLFLNKTQNRVKVRLKRDKILKMGKRLNNELKFKIWLKPMEVVVYEVTKGKVFFI